MVGPLHNGMYPISSFWRLDTLSSGSQGLSLAKVISGELNLAHLCKIAITILVLCVMSRVDPKIIRSQITTTQDEVDHEPSLPAARAVLRSFVLHGPQPL